MQRRRGSSPAQRGAEQLRRLARRTPEPPTRRRRISRREREAHRQRQLRWGIGIAAALAVLVLLLFSANDYIVKPRKVLASVDGTEIRRKDYWKYRSMTLINQSSQYQQFANFVQGDQQSQYLQLAEQARQELGTVWGSTDVDDATLGQMIDGQVFLKNLDSLNLSISDQDINDYVIRRFGPSNSALAQPSPSPTLIPERAAWATATAAAATSEALANAPVPTSASLPVPPGGPVPSSIPAPAGLAGTPPAEVAPPLATPGETSTAAAGTPGTEEAASTAVANFDQFKDATFKSAHMSRKDYDRLIVRPDLAREKAMAAIEAQIGQAAEQVHAAHILVATEELARSIHDQVATAGVNFEQVAKEQSTDQSTGANGGDLGWFTRAEMVTPFADAAFALKPGQISEPVQSQFGWHIIKVYDHTQNRAMTDEQIDKVKSARVEAWLIERKASMDIDADIAPTPTPAAAQFEAPADAPAPPAPTPLPLDPNTTAVPAP
jgi:parvulin-like peptidyl-prolyl isomerase